MRYADFAPLNELFKAPRPVNWIVRNGDAWIGDFKMGEIEFRITIENTRKPDTDRWVMVFKSMSETDSVAAYGNTGASREQATNIMSHVIDATRTFLKTQKPDELLFAGDDESGKQKENGLTKGSLYDVIVRKLTPELNAAGYSVDSEVRYGEQSFVISKTKAPAP